MFDMARLRDLRAVPTSAFVIRIVALLSMLQAVVLTVAVAGHLAQGGLLGSTGLHAADCVAASHHDEAPSPACPRHPHCCLLASAVGSPPDLFRAFVFLRPEPDEADIIGVVAEEDERGPDPSPPWSSRAPPLSA
ncbi:hypothetical protein CQW49_13675 [Methylosinus trichosporium OB3b]|uniref:DUF2946 domain-containing protein n=2 Tax=Methylocystaceae TaxID=31993 RepID=A0A2D2D1E0_METT3|nr:hypothetical protein CQW49_13675 [Methylosinus trichosporium OB3b]OBS51496.1 hypothetical protein A8B73_16040 [Methylosinus sp. 3S-1]